MTTAPTVPLVRKRRKTTVNLTGEAVDALREHVLPLLPGVSLSDILDSFLREFAGMVVPMVRAMKDAPEHLRAATAETLMAEALGRLVLNTVRTNGASFAPEEVDDG
jgi:hypothetical protein